MLSAPELVLAVTAVLAGVTGTWSPCGFSMVDTLGSRARDGGPMHALGPCAAFALGCLAGGMALFTALGSLGTLLHTSGRGAAGPAAVVVLVTAALGELRGVRVRPQIRRQVPEPWRRRLPLPVAAGLYGLLLGMGFATFVLTLAVGALAAVCLAIGDPVLGGLVGAAFGAGRALPVTVLAPLSGTDLGVRSVELMAERPASLRGLRAADGVALVLCAVAVGTGDASAATRVAAPATDPSVAGRDLAWQQPGGGGFIRRAGQTVALPGANPTLGGPYAAWRQGDLVTVARRDTLVPLFQRTVPAVEQLAISGSWLAWRARRPDGGELIQFAAIGPATPAASAASVSPAGQLGRPDLDGNRVAYHVAGRGRSRIVILNLRTGRRRTVTRARVGQVLNPSLSRGSLLYVRVGPCGQALVLRRRGRARTLLRGRALAGADVGFEPGHTSQGSGFGPCPRRRATTSMLWTTALSPRFAYASVVRPAAAAATFASVVRVGR